MRWSLVPALWILIGASVGCSAEGEVRDYTNNNAGTPEADMSAEADADPGEALELSGISPDRGPVDGDTIVTLTGRGFNAGMTVEFGQQPVSTIEVSSETTATVKAPEALQAGAVDVTVQHSVIPLFEWLGALIFLVGLAMVVYELWKNGTYRQGRPQANCVPMWKSSVPGMLRIV